jgi:protein-disulfide isomerase-like protein with CxxC motif
VWLSTVKETSGTDLVVDWQPFSLSQANSKDGEDFKIWEQAGALDGTDNTLLAHRAGLAAKRQGQQAFEAFFMALLKARHEDKKDLTDPTVIDEALAASGIDAGRFKEDLLDPDLLRELGESHTKAVEEHGAFGVPTYVFPSGHTAFIKMFIPPAEEAVEMYDNLMKVASEFKYLGELKRPQPPWPDGII